MFHLQTTKDFQKWVEQLQDARAQVAVVRRLWRLQAGNPGDFKPVGEGVAELRVDVGPGYRVYFIRRGRQVIVVLAGGDKSTQSSDIKRAIGLARELKWTN